MKLQNASSSRPRLDKGDAVEEWLDLRFFRPLGARLAKAAPPWLSADHVTLGALLTGLAAGQFFIYASPTLNLLGFVLFIISDVLDSADGQLARLRGTSTRFGRMLDGMSDYLRFGSLYGFMFLRLFLTGMRWPAALLLAVTGVISHGLQATANDFLRNLHLSAAGQGELDLPEDLPARAPPGWLGRIALSGYRGYVRRQVWLFPRTCDLVRRARAGSSALLAELASRQKPLLPLCAWIGQNIRFFLLAATAGTGHPAAYLWITITVLNGLLVFLIIAHEMIATQLMTRPTAEAA